MAFEFDVVSIAILITALGVIITALISIRQSVSSARSYEADVILRIHDNFFLREINVRIRRVIERNKPILKENNGFAEYEDLDDYLGFIELLAIFIKKKLVTKETVDDMFGHYIVDAWENKEVHNYVEETRKEENDSDYYSGLERLAKEFKYT